MNETHKIKLTGLIGSNPLGALAAFGLLKICGEIPDIINARLHWELEDDWIAVLSFNCNQKIYQDFLIDYICSKSSSFEICDVLSYQTRIREKPQFLKERLQDYAKNSSINNRATIDFCSAFASEVVTDKTKEKFVKPSSFYMVSGKQRFLKSIEDIHNSLWGSDKEKPIAEFDEALFGPWKYKDRFHSLGWDPSTERIYSLMYSDPTKSSNESGPFSVRAVVWLAFQALTFFPVIPTCKSQLLTTGFKRLNNHDEVFTWPIWNDPISIDVLRSFLVNLELWLTEDSINTLNRRGISAIYQSNRSTFGQGYAVFRPSTIRWLAE